MNIRIDYNGSAIKNEIVKSIVDGLDVSEGVFSFMLSNEAELSNLQKVFRRDFISNNDPHNVCFTKSMTDEELQDILNKGLVGKVLSAEMVDDERGYGVEMKYLTHTAFIAIESEREVIIQKI